MHKEQMVVVVLAEIDGRRYVQAVFADDTLAWEYANIRNSAAAENTHYIVLAQWPVIESLDSRALGW